MQLHRGRKKKNIISKKVKYKLEHITRVLINQGRYIDKKRVKELDSGKNRVI